MATELTEVPSSRIPLWPLLRFSYLHFGRVAPYLGRALLRLPRRWRHALVWEVARGVLRAWHDHDVAALLAVYHDNAVIDMENWSDWLDRSTYRGAEGVRQFFSDFDAAWTEFSFRPTRQLELSRERYLVEIEFEGTGASSGIQIRRRFFQIVEARSGRFTRMANYTDEGAAFEAAGLYHRESRPRRAGPLLLPLRAAPLGFVLCRLP